MNNGSSTSHRCPMCAVTICHSDLRFAIIGTTFNGMATAASVPVSTTQGTNLGSCLTSFQLLQLSRGSVFPQLPLVPLCEPPGHRQQHQQHQQQPHKDIDIASTSASHQPSLAALSELAELYAENSVAIFAKYWFPTVEQLRGMFEAEKLSLTLFRQECIDSGHSNHNDGGSFNSNTEDFRYLFNRGDVEYLPVLGEAFAHLHDKLATFEISVESYRVMNKKDTKSMSGLRGRHSSVSAHTAAAVHSTNKSKNKTTTTSTTVAALHGSDKDSSDIDANRSNSINRDNLSDGKFLSLDGWEDDGSIIYYYQASDGAIVVLHPLCMKCLLTSPPPLHQPQQQQHQQQHQQQLQAPRARTDSEISHHSLAVDDTANCSEIAPTTANDEKTAASASASAVHTSNFHNFTSDHKLILPLHFTVKVVDSEVIKVNKEWRNKAPYLRHFPENTEVTVVEIDVHKIVNKNVWKLFRSQFMARKAKRQEKKKQYLYELQQDEHERYVLLFIECLSESPFLR